MREREREGGREREGEREREREYLREEGIGFPITSSGTPDTGCIVGPTGRGAVGSSITAV